MAEEVSIWDGTQVKLGRVVKALSRYLWPWQSIKTLQETGEKQVYKPVSAQASQGVIVLFECNHLLHPGIFHGVHVDICPTVNIHELQDNLPHQVLHHRLQWYLCSGVFSLSFFTNLSECRVVLHILTPLSQLNLQVLFTPS